MRTYLKKAPPKAPFDRTKLEETVRNMLDDIAENGDAAVKSYAAKLDRWTSEEFRVSDDKIRSVVREMPETFKEDFEYARRKVTDFAKRQLDSMHEFETEIEPGIMLGQKLIAGRQRRLLHPRRQVSADLGRDHERRHGARRGRRARHRLRPAARCRRHLPADALCAARVGRRRDLRARRRAGDGVHGLWLRRHARGRHDHRARQRLCRGGEAAALRHGRHRPAGRADRDPASSPTRPPIRRSSRPTCSARPSTGRTARPGSSPPRAGWARLVAKEVELQLKTLPTARDRRRRLARPRRDRRGRHARRGDRGQRRVRARAPRGA